MSLKTRFGNLKNVLDEDRARPRFWCLDSPFVGNSQFDRLVEAFACACDNHRLYL